MTRLIATKQLRWSRHWLPYIDVATQRLRRGGGKIKRNAVPRPWAELTAFDRRNQVGLCTAADVSQHDYWTAYGWTLPRVTEQCSNPTKSDTSVPSGSLQVSLTTADLDET